MVVVVGGKNLISFGAAQGIIPMVSKYSYLTAFMIVSLLKNMTLMDRVLSVEITADGYPARDCPAGCSSVFPQSQGERCLSPLQ
jgi:hypothetical protein